MRDDLGPVHFRSGEWNILHLLANVGFEFSLFTEQHMPGKTDLRTVVYRCKNALKHSFLSVQPVFLCSMEADELDPSL